MEQAFAELPLAVFTTLAPIGAGAFIALAVAFFTTTFSDEQTARIDKLSFVPLVLVAIGFLASFMHLAAPMNAVGALSGIGHSPLSNEIVMGVVFFVVALVYCILAVMGKLNGGARKGFVAVVAVLALAFATFTGLAYMIDTIVSWATPLTVFQVIGFCLLGGTLVGTFVIGEAGALDAAKQSPFKIAALVLGIAGAIIAIGALVAQVGMVDGLVNPMLAGSSLVAEIGLYQGIFIFGALAALACEIWALFGRGGAIAATCGSIAVLAAVFSARLVFYALQMSIGL